MAEDKEKQAEQRKAEEEARTKLFAESPTGSEQAFLNDLAVVKTLTPTQWSAIRDRANKVDLTADEEKALASVTKDQRHSLSQLVAFFIWLNDQEKQAQQAADQAREQQEQEQEAERLAAYQALVAQAAQSQAQANASEQALVAQQRAQQNDIWHSLAAMAERQQEQAAALPASQQNSLKPTRTNCMNVGETVSCYSY